MSEAAALNAVDSKPNPLPSARGMGAADVALFAELLAGLVRARVPLPDAFKLLAREAESATVRRGFAVLEKDIATGVPLEAALRKQGGLFPETFVSLVSSGVQANDLYGALLEIVREYRSQVRFREALWGQLLGPLATGAAFVAIVTILIVLNVPGTFGEVFRSLHTELPASTKALLFVSDALQSPKVLAGVLALSGLCAAVLGALWLKASSRAWIQRRLLKRAFIGPFLQTVMMGRFCRLMGILLKRNMPLETALQLTAQSTSILPMRTAIEALRRKTMAGASLHDAVSAEPLFPATFSFMISGAQSHGDLPETLERLAELYEERLRIAGARLRFAIYVLASLLLALCVAWVAFAVFMPLFDLQRSLQLHIALTKK